MAKAGKEPIRRIKLADGKTVRYRLVVDLPPDPAQPGKRNQDTSTWDTLKEARAELARIRHEINTGMIVLPSKRTLNEELDAWEAGLRGKEAATLNTYRNLLAPVRRFMGTRPLQELDKAEFDKLVVWMETQGRARSVSKKYGRGHGPTSISKTLAQLQTALDVAVAERRIGYNPVRLVQRPKRSKPVHDLWSDAEEERFFACAAQDRLAALVELFARALRPEELCGLRWPHVHLIARNVAVGMIVRTMVKGKPVEKEAKTPAGIRILPLDEALTDALREWRRVQEAERENAGDAWFLDPQGGYVLADQLGAPFDTQRLRRYMYRLMDQAGVRKVTPYEAMRHAAGSRMARAGVQGHVIAAWMGHTKASFTYDNYVHARPEDLAAGRDALARVRREETGGALRHDDADRAVGKGEGQPGGAGRVAPVERPVRGPRGRVAGRRSLRHDQRGGGAGGGVQGDAAR